MKPLLTIQRVLIWHCMCPSDSTEKKSKYLLFTCVNLIIMAFGLLANIKIFVNFMEIDLDELLYGLFLFSAYVALANVMFAAFILRHKIGEIFEKLSKIYESRKFCEKIIEFTKKKLSKFQCKSSSLKIQFKARIFFNIY